jgi:tripartite-type tricarboxylate transporter receptor subunit TctC
MKMRFDRLLSLLILLVGDVALPSPAIAVDFPTRQVQIVVPYTPGAMVDIAARTFATKLSSYWGQPVIVDNRPGAGSTLGARLVAQAQPDGYTLLFSINETFTVVPHLATHRSFQPLSDLTPINLLATLTNAIVVNPSLPVTTLPELIAHAKANPGALRYGSPGHGSNVHLAMEMLKSLAKIDIQHVPYRGLAPATTAVIANEVHIGMAGYSGRELVESGRLRVIATAGPERLPAFGTVPTTAETGYSKVDSSTWLLIAAPAKTPKDILDKINSDLSRALNDPDMRRELIERRGLAIANIGRDTAMAHLERRSREDAEMVKVSGADRE